MQYERLETMAASFLQSTEEEVDTFVEWNNKCGHKNEDSSHVIFH